MAFVFHRAYCPRCGNPLYHLCGQLVCPVCGYRERYVISGHGEKYVVT